MPRTPLNDGPRSPLFTPIPLAGTTSLKALSRRGTSEAMRANACHAPEGPCTAWGIPFDVGRVILASDRPVVEAWRGFKAPWLVFMHTTDFVPPDRNEDGLISPMRGAGRLGEWVADYVFVYADGTEVREKILRRRQIGMLMRTHWGEVCFEAVGPQKPHPVPSLTDQPHFGGAWGWSQQHIANPDWKPWMNWLWAWENPHPRKPITGLRIEPQAPLVISAVTLGRVSSMPLRWGSRQKALWRLPKGERFDPAYAANGTVKQLQIDLGQVISVMPKFEYPNDTWKDSYNNQVPAVREDTFIVEYTAHPEARFHFADETAVPVEALGSRKALTPVAPATRRVRLRVVEKGSTTPVAVKLHVHGEAGEYLAPVDRHRIPNPNWFEDYGADFLNERNHFCTYIPGETVIDLPLGTVYIEVSKGFEIAPIRRVVRVGPATREITFTLKRVLPWRARGWVTADTHVHFLSPPTAGLEGAGEDVNVVNLLASQWGELMTNVGDFDGRTTFGAKEAGGTGEYLVRVSTENRQHTLGHISLLGYNGPIIAPMCVGGADESALGDPVAVLLTEWAQQCRKQGGMVVIPHFPNPRAEHAATIVTGNADAIEMTSWGWHYGGIDPYSLSDWYRYLNCGHFIPAVGGTDKMSADTSVGTIRTYARLPEGREFTYDAWMDAVRSGNTFVSYGPLVEFAVDGRPAGARIAMGRSGGTVDVEWTVASVTVPLSRVDLVVNGEIVESRAVDPREDTGRWRVKVGKSSWMALLVRGHYPDKPEMIAAHTSPVVVPVEGSPFFAAADALTILEQIEGAIAFFDTMATRADEAARKRMRLVLTGAYRALHNRLHQQGYDHPHTHATGHPGHHRARGPRRR